MRWRLLLWSLCLLVPCARAQAPSLDGSVSFRLDSWTGDRQLTDRGDITAASAWGRGKAVFGDSGEVVANAWLRDSTRSDGEPPGRVRELYWRRDAGPLQLRIGRQLVVWGRADGLNPTDNLSPRDFTLLVPEDGDQRRGADAVSAAAHVGPGDLTLLWMPHAASNTLPLPATTGVRYLVEPPPRRHQWAIKWDGQGGSIDGSVSYFDGDDLTPDIDLAGLSNTGVDVAVRNPRARVVGADMSWAREGVVWRAEGAWLRTVSAGSQDFSHKRSQLWLVAGGEWQLPARTTLSLQASLQHVFDFASPDNLANPVERAVAWRQASTAAQTSANPVGVLWRLATRARDDSVQSELSGVVVGPKGAGLVRGSSDYAVNDHVNVRVGFNWLFGAEHSYFGQLRANRLAYVQIRYSL